MGDPDYGVYIHSGTRLRGVSMHRTTGCHCVLANCELAKKC